MIRERKSGAGFPFLMVIELPPRRGQRMNIWIAIIITINKTQKP